jgi:hypothetical protein
MTRKEAPSAFTLPLNAFPEDSPMVIYPFARPHLGEDQMAWEEVSYERHPVFAGNREPLVRVFPETGKDVSFLRLLEHRVDKFAPAHGGGVLIKARLLA